MKNSRGYFGIGIENPSKDVNIGTLCRSAYNFGADFIFTIGRKYWRQSSDTVAAYKNIPIYNYSDFDDLYKHLPYDCRIVGIELSEKSRNLKTFNHFERAIYLLGNEGNGLSKNALDKCHCLVQIDSNRCLNVSMAATCVMYDRAIKQ